LREGAALFENFQLRKKQLLELIQQEQNQERVRSELATFFGPRPDAYLKVYEKIRFRTDGRKIFPMTWSWPVFVGGFTWFFYRKMYGAGAALIVVPIVIVLLFGSAGSASLAYFAVSAKSMYVYSALGRILKADSLGLSGAERSDYLRRAGGVSLVAGVLAGVLYVAMFGFAILAVVAEFQAVH
jgi:hypothetical protein